MRLACLGLLLTVAIAHDVQELHRAEVGEAQFDGGENTHPAPPAEGTGYMKVAPGIANFPGPKYGLPGYKESHTWESGEGSPQRTSPL